MVFPCAQRGSEEGVKETLTRVGVCVACVRACTCCMCVHVCVLVCTCVVCARTYTSVLHAGS